MKIFMIGSGVPYREHNQEGVSAINIQLYECIRALARLEHEIVLQIIFNMPRRHILQADSLLPSEVSELLHLGQLGVVVLPPIYWEQYLKSSYPLSRTRRLARQSMRFFLGQGRVEDFYPTVNVRGIVREHIRSSGSDVIFTFGSPEGVAATYGFHELPKIAYQGDRDFYAGEIHMKERALFFGPANTRSSGIIRQGLGMLHDRLWIANFKRAHVRLMLDVDVIANGQASDVDFYKRHEHPRNFYLGTTWKDVGVGYVNFSQVNLSDRTIKIIGSVGLLNSTGRTIGLKFLLVDLTPVLKNVMDGLDYRIHIVGSGEVVSSLRPWLGQEHIVMRGYVEDLDSELRSSTVFLLLDNAGRKVGAYSRTILAWSMGLCLIVHANSKKAVPEIKHMENALTGSTPKEIAQMVYLAATDRDLNKRIRQGGRATYERHFSPMVIAGKLSQEMERLVAKSFDARDPYEQRA